MATPKLIQKPGNVYHTPTHTPESKREWREVKGVLWEHDSEDNINSWRDVFMEIGEACPDRTQRRRRTRR